MMAVVKMRVLDGSGVRTLLVRFKKDEDAANFVSTIGALMNTDNHDVWLQAKHPYRRTGINLSKFSYVDAEVIARPHLMRALFTAAAVVGGVTLAGWLLSHL